MKARNIIPDWPRGTSTSKPYESDMSSVWWWPYLRRWPREDRLKLLHEQAMEKEYREAQARMMDDWHRSRSQATSELTHKLFAGELSRPDFPKEKRWGSDSVFMEEVREKERQSTQALLDGLALGHRYAGRPYYEPLEDHIWPTYGGITRTSAPASAFLNSAPNWTPSDAGNITLEKLKAVADSIPKMPKFPPYYRAHPITLSTLSSFLAKSGERLNIHPTPTFNATSIREDVTVPLGKFWPPEGWKADE